jgi:hypothetical protein
MRDWDRNRRSSFDLPYTGIGSPEADATDALRYAMGPTTPTVDEEIEKKISQLIAVANAGRHALERLFELIPDRMEIMCKDNEQYGRKAGTWGTLKSVKKILYRARPMKDIDLPVGAFVAKLVDPSNIKIGCKIFNLNDLHNSLNHLMNDTSSSSFGDQHGNTHEFHATRNGVVYFFMDVDRRTEQAPSKVTWADVEALLKAIEEYRK